MAIKKNLFPQKAINCDDFILPYIQLGYGVNFSPYIHVVQVALSNIREASLRKMVNSTSTIIMTNTGARGAS